jgi:DNA polymerase-3 subunit delta'
MAFRDLTEAKHGIELLQRSLEQGRLGHAYLFAGRDISRLEALAQSLAKTLNCQNPVKRNGVATDCCEECLNCQKIEHGNHADVLWVRPESRLRVIRMNQITRRDNSPPRVLLEFVNLKPTESSYKIGIIVCADRMNEQAANAFLKTLEEPPQNSILVLLTTEPERVLETIRSRCLRLMFGGEGRRELPPAVRAWLANFSQMAAAGQKTLLGRYRLMDVLLKRLNELKAGIEEGLTARSPLQQYKDAEKDLQEKWEDELKAAIEAEYRGQRAELLAVLQAWLRDVWLQAIAKPADVMAPPASDRELLNFPDLPGTKEVAQRLSAREALENLQVMERLQRVLHTNVQEALALEVGLLKLAL